LSGSALKVPGGGVVGWGGVVASYPLLSQAPTPVEVELGCDNINIHVTMYILLHFSLNLRMTQNAKLYPSMLRNNHILALSNYGS
jgi:hypothetical protein